ncbi:MAG: hypothetical protein DWC10_02560 [Candidatus Poseidoniales archaeon]|nr:MAG: hypothetical protein DWC10_02560 [Candidatus Poseidoniales archaeon]
MGEGTDDLRFKFVGFHFFQQTASHGCGSHTVTCNEQTWAFVRLNALDSLNHEFHGRRVANASNITNRPRAFMLSFLDRKRRKRPIFNGDTFQSMVSQPFDESFV